MRIIAAVIALATACGGPGPESGPDAITPADLDAGPDAPTCPAAPPTPDRIASCARVCGDTGPSSQACPGANDLIYPACQIECRAGVANIGWCPR